MELAESGINGAALASLFGIDDLEPKLEQAKAKAMEIADTADDKWDDVKGWDRFTFSVKSLFS